MHDKQSFLGTETDMFPLSLHKAKNNINRKQMDNLPIS